MILLNQQVFLVLVAIALCRRIGRPRTLEYRIFLKNYSIKLDLRNILIRLKNFSNYFNNSRYQKFLLRSYRKNLIFLEIVKNIFLLFINNFRIRVFFRVSGFF